MNDFHTSTCRYFVTYTGIKLPFKLVNPLTEADIHNRNTFLRAYFDDAERLIGFQKVT
jgi:hypothetical protein